MTSHLLSIARASLDGEVTGISAHEKPHPVYGTPAHDVRVYIPFTPEEEEATRECTDQMVGSVRYSIRSWAAQLGLVGFSRDYSSLHIVSGGAEVETLVSDLSGKENNPLLPSLQRSVRSGVARIARGLILPHQAICGHQVLPVCQDIHYDFDHESIPLNLLDQMWSGALSGREVIQRYRKNLGSLPDTLPPRGYLIGSVQADVGDNEYWMLESQILRGNRANGYTRAKALHEESCAFDPSRTSKDRQVEIVSINGSNEPLGDIAVQATAYHTDPQKLHCVHLEGV